MINLLPNDEKEQITFARRNSRLVKWCAVLLIGIVGIAAVVLFGQIYITQNTKTIAKEAAATQEQLKAQQLDETRKRVTDISTSLKLVVQVLSKEVLFSKLIKQVGAVTPTGATLTNLSITKIEGGIDLQFGAKDYQTATQVQVNLQDPANSIFEKADILNINCSSAAAADPRYPCTVSIRALFSKNNPFLFINSQTSGAKP